MNHYIYYILLFTWLVALLVAMFFVIKIGYIFFSNAWKHRKLPPYVNSFAHHLRLLNQYDWKDWFTILDLWCGDGKSLRYMSNRFDMRQWVWYDINSFAVWYGNFINKLLSLLGRSGDHIILKNENIYKADLGWYDYIYVYLFPDFMAEMEDWLWSHCDKWTIIIANTFQFAKHKPSQTIKNKKWKIVYRFYKV